MMDSRERIVRKRLSAEYKKAEKELQKELDEYFKRFHKQDKEKAKLVLQGKLDQSEYIKWRKNKMLYKETLSQKVDVMSQHLLNVNKQARGIIRKETFGVYADQYNFGVYQVEKGLHIDTSFTLFDQTTVERMAEKNPKLLPERKAPDGKILKYSRRKVNTAITQGVLQGESIDDVAKRLTQVVGMEERYALTNARTAMTGAQNAGRLDSYIAMKKMGIKLRKQWMATLDERTRTSHQEMDGEIVDIEEKFSNGLEYPGDPKGHPREVYNCRCTMIAELPDFPPENMQRLDNIDKTPIDYVTYKEWKVSKEKVNSKMATPTVTKTLASLERIEREDRRLNYERGAVVARDGTIVARYDGKEHSVEVSDSDLEQMSGNIFTHNHPSGNFFSDNDILTGFVKTDLYELRASTPDGIVYSLKNNGVTKESARKFLVDYKQTSEKSMRMAQEHLIRKVRMGELSIEEYKRNYYKLYMQYRDEMLIRMTREKAADYGLIFEVIEP